MPRHLLAACCAAGVFLGAATPAIGQTNTQDDSAARASARANTLPLITTRTLEFTTDEGTWISVDVAPDGRTIVFDLLGDLYTLPIAGGKATRITSGPPFDAQPRWSPDGKHVVFTSDRSGSQNLWVVDADGSRARPLTKTQRDRYVSPAWTPDGNYVIASKGNDLWLYNTEGGSGLRLTGVAGAAGGGQPAAGPPTPFAGPAFGGSARYVWVTVSGNPVFPVGRDVDQVGIIGRTDQADSASSGRQVAPSQIGQYDRETGVTVVRTEELEGAYRPVASPDGHWLVYATRYDARTVLKLRDLTTGDVRWLVMDAQPDDHEASHSRDHYPGSAFTPDSKALITSYGGKIMRVEIPSGRATPIPFSADVQLPMGPLAKSEYPINDSVITVAQIRGARPSPDGRRIVFGALDRLWIADLPAGRGGSREERQTVTSARRLTTMAIGEHEPVWSPDGQYVAYVTWNDSTGGDIYRARGDGSGQPERLTRESSFYDKISYAPNGAKLVGMRSSKMHQMRILEDIGSNRNAERELVWLPAGGGEVHRIAYVYGGTTQQGRQTPHFGPDTGRVYLYEPSDGLLSIRFDGTDRRALFKVTGVAPPSEPGGAPGGGGPPPADEILMSPDGQRALVASQHNVYLVTVPPVGGQTPTISLAGSTTVPTRRLTRVGGDFIGWQDDGKSVFYSIGHTFFRYHLGVADSLVRDSTDKAEAAATTGGARADSGRAGARAAVYEPQRVDIVIHVPKDRPNGFIALRGARLLTMKGSEIVDNGDILVKDNRIAAIGRRGSVRIPDGAKVIDVSGKTILPGYVDIHAHLWATWGVHRMQVSQYLAQLAYGVTTQRDPQTSTEDVLTYSDLVETGALIGPRMYSTGPGIFSSDLISSFDDARDVLRRYSDYYDTKTIKQYMVGDRKVRQWVIAAARELGLTPTTEGGQDFMMNLTLMQDGYPGLEHSLPIHPLFRDVVQLEAFSGITYTPTLIVSYGGPWGRQYYLTHYDIDKDPKLRYFTPHDELDKWERTTWNRDDQYVFPAIARELPKLLAAGGHVGMGSHGEVQGIGVHWEIWMLASGGLPPYEVLRIATQSGASAIGLGRDIGSLEPGKLADLQVLDKNPLLDIKNTNSLRYVMKNGRLYDASTLNEVWPRQRPLGEQWWWRLDPPASKTTGASAP